MRARYYNPEIMRFINVDPIKDGWNWYAYANGDPISLFDPFGLSAECPSGINWKSFFNAFAAICTVLGALVAGPVLGPILLVIGAGVHALNAVAHFRDCRTAQ